jgi:hypothetical protein
LVAITWSLVPKDGQEVLENYTPKEGEDTITTIIKLLRKVLTIQDSQQAAQEALKGIKKKREESERTFANRVETLIKKAFLSLNEKERDQMITNCFVAGHNLKMQELLFTKNAKGFAETLEEAVRQEAWIIKKLVLEEEAMNLRQLKEGAQEKMQKSKNANGYKSNFSHSYQNESSNTNVKKRSYCGVIGHWEERCYKKMNNENSQTGSTQYQGGNQVQKWSGNQNQDGGKNYQRNDYNWGSGEQNQVQRKDYQREQYNSNQNGSSTNQKQQHTLESIGEQLARLKEIHQQLEDYNSKCYPKGYKEQHGPLPPHVWHYKI